MDSDFFFSILADTCPAGIDARLYPEVANIIASKVNIMAATHTLVWNEAANKFHWVDRKGAVDDRKFDGCREIAEAKKANVAFGNARPKPGDLKPSESLIRDLQKKALEPLERQRAEARARLEQLDRDIEAGKVRIADGVRLGNGVAVPLPNGATAIVPDHMVSEADRALINARREAALERAYPQEQALPREQGPVGMDGLTSEERLMVNKHLVESAKSDVSIVSDAPAPDALMPRRDREVSMASIMSFDKGAFKEIPKPGF